MAGTRITMIEADEAHHELITQQSTRSFEFPDGNVRLITLENQCWVTLDWLITENMLRLEGFIAATWKIATKGIEATDGQFLDLEAALRYAFRWGLKAWRNDENEQGLGVANENLIDPNNGARQLG